MAQWLCIDVISKINSGFLQRIQLIYKQYPLLLSVRNTCAEWIESQDWCVTDSAARTLLHNFMYEIRKPEYNMESDISGSADMEKLKEDLMAMFHDDPDNFVRIMQTCLQQEKALIDSFQPEEDYLHENDNVQSTSDVCASTLHENRARNLDDFKAKVQILEEKLEVVRLAETDSNGEENSICNQMNECCSLYKEIADELLCVKASLEPLLRKTWKSIADWQYRLLQSISTYEPLQEELTRLHADCSEIVKQLTGYRTVCQHLISLACNEMTDELRLTVQWLHEMLVTHLQRVFVISQQKTRVLKVVKETSNTFIFEVSLLGISDKNAVKVSTEFFKEEDIEKAVNDHSVKGLGTVTNGQKMLCSLSGRTGCRFNVKMTKLNRIPKSSLQRVTGFKYAMVCRASLSMANEIFKLNAVSLPIVIISHGNQYQSALSTLQWDAAFSDQDRKPFDEKQDVYWTDVVKLINDLFRQQKLRELSESQLNNLQKVAFRTAESLGNEKISKQKLMEDPLTIEGKKKKKKGTSKMTKDFPFSFWHWLLACLNLISDHLKEEWQQGLVDGFILKSDADQLLARQADGCFLIRFSNSHLENYNGATSYVCLSVAIVTIRNGEKQVTHFKDVHNLSVEAIKKRDCLGNILCSMVAQGENTPLLKCLYPNKAFPEAFQKAMHKSSQNDFPDYTAGHNRIEIPIIRYRSVDSSVMASVSPPMSPESSFQQHQQQQQQQQQHAQLTGDIDPLIGSAAFNAELNAVIEQMQLERNVEGEEEEDFALSNDEIGKWFA